MTESALLDAQVQTKRMYNALSEAMDLTRQLAEAADRDDQVTIQMLVSMREEPVKVLRQPRQALEQQKEVLGPQDGQQLARLLRGEDPENPEEEALAKQVGTNLRLLQQLQELDKILNLRLTRGKSYYRTEQGT